MGSEGSTERRHRPGLDGLRGIAVAIVVAYHLGILSGGFLGVDVFFVLSGLLITSLALAEADRTGSVDLRSFWGRRIRRLVPALLVMTTVVVGAALALGWPADERRSLAIDATATVTWWANWRQAGGASYWESGESLFRHAWSLSIEEQFYLVWPLVLVGVAALARRRGTSLPVAIGTAAAIGATASAAWMIVLANRVDDASLSRVYVGTDTRVFAPLAGCALACLLAPRPGGQRAGGGRRVRVAGGLVGAAVLTAMVVLADVSSPDLYRRGGFVLATLAAVLVVWSVVDAIPTDRDPLGWASTRRLTRYLGTRSYGLYLWSWPVQVLLTFRWPEISTSVLAAATVGASVALAEASHRLVEEPIRRSTGWAAPVRVRRPAWAVAGASVAVVVALAATTAEAPPAHETVETEQAAADALRPALTTTAPASADPPDASGDPPAPAPLRVLVTGDSVAWTVGYYRPPADQLPPGIGSVDSRAIIGCGLLAAEGWSFPKGGLGGPFTPASEACADQPEAERLGLEGAPDVVLLFPGAWEWGDVRSPEGEVFASRSPELAEVLDERIQARIRAAQEVGARFVLVEWACPGSLAADVRGDPEFIEWINGVMADAAARAVEEQGADVDVLEPTDEVCIDGDPLGDPTPAKVEATGDEVHVTSEAGGRWIWETWLGPALVDR